MSRVGRQPIAIPDKVKVQVNGATVRVEGPKGSLEYAARPEVRVAVKDGQVVVERSSDERMAKSLHGLTRTLVANMVKGVTEGYQKELELVGVGYRAQVQGKQLSMQVGFSHAVQYPIPAGIVIETPQPTRVVVKGINKEQVGMVAAQIRQVAPPEPYKGKGIRYLGEVVRRKAGKAVAGKGAGASAGGAG